MEELYMKLSTSTKWLAMLLAAFLAFGQASAVWAQAEPEEEEEMLQNRPNPMERTGAMRKGTATQKGSQMQMKQQAGQQMSNKAKAGALKGQAAHPGGAMHQTPGAMK